ncbi:MAG: endonuclease III [Spirochaetia bacterium]|nr:endonuclease III [Spirochaetota bacterium]MCX8096953.1 endonuclease III [Spirochaetota bacterium]MDW8112406.1 endonuclease III [Spirochaetia bacterium]
MNESKNVIISSKYSVEDKVGRILAFLEEVWEKEDAPLKKYVNSKGETPFQVLISTILSLRTKDDITYPTSKKLFEILKTPEDFVKIDTKKLEKLIYPVGFFRNKAKTIKEVSRIILDKYNGIVPSELEELLKLPGVGRKTANLVLSVAFGKDAICVDTHVHRISNRIGLVKTKNPTETEFELMKILPKEHWGKINHLMVAFGQTICKPVKPRCKECKLKDVCNYYFGKV